MFLTAQFSNYKTLYFDLIVTSYNYAIKAILMVNDTYFVNKNKISYE